MYLIISSHTGGVLLALKTATHLKKVTERRRGRTIGWCTTEQRLPPLPVLVTCLCFTGYKNNCLLSQAQMVSVFPHCVASSNLLAAQDWWCLYLDRLQNIGKVGTTERNNKTLFGLDECNFNELPSNLDVLSNTFAQDNEIYSLKKTFLFAASWSLLLSSSLLLGGEYESLCRVEKQKWEEQLC